MFNRGTAPRAVTAEIVRWEHRAGRAQAHGKQGQQEARTLVLTASASCSLHADLRMNKTLIALVEFIQEFPERAAHFSKRAPAQARATGECEQIKQQNK